MLGTSKHKDQIPTFFQKNGQVISDCLEIVNGFNGFFAGIGPKLAAEIGPTDVSFDSYLKGDKTSSFEFSRISEVDILYTCRQLKPKLSSGADFISTKLLKQIAPIILIPLQYLIN